MNISNIPKVVTAACILHNVCEIHGEYFDSWLREVEDSSLPQPTSSSVRGEGSLAAKRVRDALVYYFNNN